MTRRRICCVFNDIIIQMKGPTIIFGAAYDSSQCTRMILEAGWIIAKLLARTDSNRLVEICTS